MPVFQPSARRVLPQFQFCTDTYPLPKAASDRWTHLQPSAFLECRNARREGSCHWLPARFALSMRRTLWHLTPGCVRPSSGTCPSGDGLAPYHELRPSILTCSVKVALGLLLATSCATAVAEAKAREPPFATFRTQESVRHCTRLAIIRRRHPLVKLLQRRIIIGFPCALKPLRAQLPKHKRLLDINPLWALRQPEVDSGVPGIYSFALFYKHGLAVCRRQVHENGSANRTSPTCSVVMSELPACQSYLSCRLVRHIQWVHRNGAVRHPVGLGIEKLYS